MLILFWTLIEVDQVLLLESPSVLSTLIFIYVNGMFSCKRTLVKHEEHILFSLMDEFWSISMYFYTIFICFYLRAQSLLT